MMDAAPCGGGRLPQTDAAISGRDRRVQQWRESLAFEQGHKPFG